MKALVLALFCVGLCLARRPHPNNYPNYPPGGSDDQEHDFPHGEPTTPSSSGYNNGYNLPNGGMNTPGYNGYDQVESETEVPTTEVPTTEAPETTPIGNDQPQPMSTPEPVQSLTVSSCDVKSLDLVFVVDVSGSIGITNFNNMMDALRSTVGKINVGKAVDQTQIGMVTFSDDAHLQFSLTDFSDNADLDNALANVPYTRGGTNITSGMMMAINDVFNEGDRPNAANIMVVITDGQDNSDVAAAQADAEAKGITVFAVGVGDGVDVSQLELVAGSPNRVITATSFDFLGGIFQNICNSLANANVQTINGISRIFPGP
jgi:uncharacterized protein YegL